MYTVTDSDTDTVTDTDMVQTSIVLYNGMSVSMSY